MLSAIVPGEHEDVLRDVAHRPAQRVPVEVADVLTVEAAPWPERGSSKRSTRRSSDDLPAAGGADDRVGLAGRDDQVDVVEHVRPVAVPGADAASSIRPRDRSRQCAWRRPAR